MVALESQVMKIFVSIFDWTRGKLDESCGDFFVGYFKDSVIKVGLSFCNRFITRCAEKFVLR